MNCLELDAVVAEREIMRFTPAGIPMLAVLLSHQSSVTEAGRPRQVQMTLSALVAGTLAQTVESLPLGTSFRFRGFLAPRRQQARTLVFHITELQDIGKD